MKRVILLVLIGLAVSFCTEKEEVPVTNVVGTWNWISSTGGIAGVTETPESTGKEIKLVITQDSFKTYENGELTSESNYTIEIKESLLFGELREMIILEDGFCKMISRNSNKLVLVDDCYDCFTSEYVKE